MNPAFEILPESLIATETDLFCEVSSSSFNYFFVNTAERKITGLSVFYYETNDPIEIADAVKQIFREQRVLEKKFRKIYISWSSEESALLTEELYRKGNHETALHLLYGDISNETVLTDLVADKNIYNIYFIPAVIHNVITAQFPMAIITHQYSLLLKQIDERSSMLQVIFYPDKIIATLIVEGKLLLMQTYHYRSAADIIYHLLNIYKQFDVNPALQVQGMIEENTELHKKLKQYFPDIVFYKAQSEYVIAADIEKIPAHYFSHLFSNYLCV